MSLSSSFCAGTWLGVLKLHCSRRGVACPGAKSQANEKRDTVDADRIQRVPGLRVESVAIANLLNPLLCLASCCGREARISAGDAAICLFWFGPHMKKFSAGFLQWVHPYIAILFKLLPLLVYNFRQVALDVVDIFNCKGRYILRIVCLAVNTMQTVLILVHSLGAALASSSLNRTCKAYPGTTEWPSSASWQHLNKTLDGRLLSPTPPAAVCHFDQPSYNADQCLTVQKDWTVWDFHTNNPVSVVWDQFANDTCLPDPEAPCSPRGYPPFVVNARTPEHIKLGVDFGT